MLDVTADELLTGKSNEVRLLPANERKSLEELTLRIKVNSGEGDRVRVNLPMSLVKIALEMGVEIGPSMHGMDGAAVLQNLDMSKIVDMVERGMIGKIVEVESSDGDTVEIVVE